MNELIFFLHTLLVMGFGFGALKMGRTALTGWVALQAVMANLFVLKQVCLFGFHVTCSDVFAVGSIFGLNLLREYFGQDAAKKTLGICLFAMVFFVAMAQIHLFYLPSPFDASQGAFKSILGWSPRLFGASLFVFFLVTHIDLRLFGMLKDRLPLSIRNGLSVTISEFLDTLLFSILGLWGIVAHLSDVILVSFLIKFCVIALMSPLIHFSRRFVKAGSV